MTIITYTGSLGAILSGTVNDDSYIVDPVLLGTGFTTISDGGGADILLIYDHTGVRDAGEFENTGSALIWRNFEGGEVVMPFDSNGNPIIETLEWRAAPGDGTYRYSLTVTTDLRPGTGGSLAIAGTAGDDMIVGRDHGVATSGWNEIYANKGDDIVTTSATQHSYVYGGDGNDRISAGGSASSDQRGDGGNDILTGGIGTDVLNGGTGRDTLYGGDGDDVLTGNDGNDVIYDGFGNDRVDGGKGNDTFYIGSGEDTIEGGAGNDTLVVDVSGVSRGTYTVFWNMATGEHGGKEFTKFRDVYTGIENYTLIGEVDIDIIGNGKASHFITGAGWDTVYGGGGMDTIEAGAGNDTLKGGAGKDTLKGGAGADNLSGGSGSDRLEGGAGNDRLKGGNNKDSLKGGKGADDLKGGKGSDVLKGGNGGDVLDGGKGDDTLTGGSARDTFVFNNANGSDIITDFQDDIDTLQLDEDLWGGGLTKQQVVNQFADVMGADTVFNFGDYTLTIKGFTDLTELRDDISLI